MNNFDEIDIINNIYKRRHRLKIWKSRLYE